jgi:hypothetical protein
MTQARTAVTLDLNRHADSKDAGQNNQSMSQEPSVAMVPARLGKGEDHDNPGQAHQE